MSEFRRDDTLTVITKREKQQKLQSQQTNGQTSKPQINEQTNKQVFAIEVSGDIHTTHKPCVCVVSGVLSRSLPFFIYIYTYIHIITPHIYTKFFRFSRDLVAAAAAAAATAAAEDQAKHQLF